MQLKNLTIGVDIDMQKFYDDLILYRDSLNIQIESIGKSPSICTHRKIEEFGYNGIKICANKHCGKIIDGGVHDWCI